jgi:hypothetical protein
MPSVTVSISTTSSTRPQGSTDHGSHRWLAGLGIVIAALVALGIPLFLRRRAAQR